MKKMKVIVCTLILASMLSGCAAYVGGYYPHHYYGPGAGVYVY